MGSSLLLPLFQIAQIATSKISTLITWLGTVSDDFDERIEKKIFHAEIVMDNEKWMPKPKLTRGCRKFYLL